jgi:hypothetical protein
MESKTVYKSKLTLIKQALQEFSIKVSNREVSILMRRERFITGIYLKTTNQSNKLLRMANLLWSWLMSLDNWLTTINVLKFKYVWPTTQQASEQLQKLESLVATALLIFLKMGWFKISIMTEKSSFRGTNIMARLWNVSSD